jgi:serine/threonine protein kinase
MIALLPRKRIRMATERYVYPDREEIGSGGFGKVRVAHDMSLDRDVAVKSLDPILRTFSEAEQERFKREARTLAKLSHPNIPAVYDVEFTGDKFNIIFQFIEGKNLRRIIETNGPSPLTMVRQWFQQIGSALEHAHKLGVIHRDIKPENIIVTEDLQTAYLVDFGIALSSEEAKRLTETGYVVGTPGYMSPEQIAGHELDGRTDIYSLGLTFYEVLAGKRMPAADYEELSAANEGIPPSIDDLILECVEQNRDQRLSSAIQFNLKLARAFSQAARPLSDVLAHGRLHEITLAIEEYTAEGFMALPPGQRALILTKVFDVVGSNDSRLDFAAERFLELMLTRGVQLDRDNYREIVVPAINWAFEKSFAGSTREGRESIRIALGEASFNARDGAYDVLTEEILAYLAEINLNDKDEWYLHTTRIVVEALMANPTCEAAATPLAKMLRSINRAQRSRTRVAKTLW